MEALVAWAWPYLLAAGVALAGAWQLFASGREQGVTQKGRAMPSNAKRISIASSGLLMLGLLEACTTTPSTATGSDVCIVWRPVTYSASHDSAETINEARENNARRAAYCGS